MAAAVPDPRHDPVARQYERWSYPPPIADVAAWLQDHWEWFDPSHAFPVLWPERAPRADLDILIAGCGTNQAAVFAHTNPRARVLAIDVSQASLAHEERLKHKHGLWNLELRHLPIEEIGTLGRAFDLIVSTGVLHHLADPLAGLKALAACLRPDGAMGLMLYARYGRIGVELMESTFRAMGLGQDEASIEIVKRTLAGLPPEHPVRTYLQSAPDLHADAGLVDTFLHGRERSYTVDDCLRLVESAGLAFQGWLLNAPYHAHDLPRASDPYYDAVNALAPPELWRVMERIHTGNARHFFMACRPERARAQGAIDFAAPGIDERVPCWRWRCGLEQGVAVRPGWRLALDAPHHALARAIDGRRSLRQIAEQAAREPCFAQADPAQRTAFARGFMQALWRLDFVALTWGEGARAPLQARTAAPEAGER